MRMKDFYKSHLIHSSKDATWRTPRWLFDELNLEFNFGLDGAATQESTLVPDNWYGPDHPDEGRRDGLSRDWSSDTSKMVWLNPPYGTGVTQAWLQKATVEASKGIETMVLIPSRTGTLWFHDLCFPHRIRFIKRRLKFNDGNKPAPFDSALVWIKGQPDPGYF